MTHKIEIYQQTTANDIAIVTISDDDLANITELREHGTAILLQEFLVTLTKDADEWLTGDTIDGNLPHYYEVDGKPFGV